MVCVEGEKGWSTVGPYQVLHWKELKNTIALNTQGQMLDLGLFCLIAFGTTVDQHNHYLYDPLAINLR